jgi:hypothetical protein
MKLSLHTQALLGLFLLTSSTAGAVRRPVRGARVLQDGPIAGDPKPGLQPPPPPPPPTKLPFDDKARVDEGPLDPKLKDDPKKIGVGPAGGRVDESFEGECDLASHLQTRDDEFDAEETARHAELIALETSGELVAPTALVEKINADLTVIRQTYGTMNAIDHDIEWVPGEIIVVFTPEAQEQILQGTYSFEELEAVTSEFGQATLEGSLYRFETPYNSELLAEEYKKANITGVSDVTPNINVGATDRILLQEATQEASIYRFEIGYGDCISSCTCKDYWEFHVKQGDNGEMISALMESSTDFIPMSTCDVETALETRDLSFDETRNKQEAGLVALEYSGDLLATARMVDQIDADLAAIRGAYANMNGVIHSAPWKAGEVIVFLDDDAAQQVESGSYNFDTLNAVTGSFGSPSEEISAGQIVYKYEEPYHPERVATAILEANAPGVTAVTPSLVPGDNDRIILTSTTPSVLYKFELKYGENCDVECTCGDFWMYEITQDGPVLVESGAVDRLVRSVAAAKATFAILPLSLLVGGLLGLIL